MRQIRACKREPDSCKRDPRRLIETKRRDKLMVSVLF